MFEKQARSLGNKLVNMGESLVDDGDAYRVEYGNPREVPQSTVYDKLGARLQNIGHSLVEYSIKNN